jgi:hypothetical protein
MSQAEKEKASTTTLPIVRSMDRYHLYISGSNADYSCILLGYSLTERQAEKEAKKKEVS